MPIEDRLRVNINGQYDPPKKHTLGEISEAVAKMALEKVSAAQHRMHLTAFGVGLAVLILNDVILLSIVLAVIGGR